MHLHHDKHHQAYVDNANKALDGTESADHVEEVLRNLDSLPQDKRAPVRNNAGGHANHSLFWEIMGPGGGGEPGGELADAIGDAFGSFDDFKSAVNEPASSASAPAGRGSSGTARASRSTRRRTRTRRCRRTTCRSSASTSGSTRTTSPTRTAGRTTSPRGGTS